MDIYERMLYYRVCGLSLAVIKEGSIHSAQGFGTWEGEP